MELFIFLIFGVVSRLIPHPANFSPIGAFLLFGVKKQGWKYAALLALLTMLITDIFLGFSQVSIYVYLGILAYIPAGYIISKKWYSYILAPAAGSILFFVISNFGVWLGPWYSHDLAGFIRCFTLAIPFYRNTILGDLAFTLLTFGAYGIYKIIITKKGEGWQKLLPRPNLTKK